MNNFTTKEQSLNLVKLGLNRDTADMCYYYNFVTETNSEIPAVVVGTLHDTTSNNIPCWSVGALLELMQPTIKPKDREESCNMEFFKGLSGKFHFRYMGAGGPTDMLNLVMGTPIECAYQMICWLLQNNYIKTE